MRKNNSNKKNQSLESSELCDKENISADTPSAEIFENTETKKDNSESIDQPENAVNDTTEETRQPESNVDISKFEPQIVDGFVFFNALKRSFRSKIIQANSTIQNYYSEIKNKFLSYKKVNSRMSWVAESFKLGRVLKAKMTVRGKTLCLFLALNPDEFNSNIYHQRNFGDIKKYVDVPLMLRVRSRLGLKRALNLIDLMLKDVAPNPKFESKVYSYPYETDDELIARDLIRRVRTRRFFNIHDNETVEAAVVRIVSENQSAQFVESDDLNENEDSDDNDIEFAENVSESEQLAETTETAEEESEINDDISKCDAKVRLPYYATIVNKNGEKIGKVKRGVCYDLDKQRRAEFVRQDTGVNLVDNDEIKGYLDKNDNVFDTENRYAATLKRSRLWLLLLIALLIVALVVVSALFAALYTPQSRNYIPTLFIADADGKSWDEKENLSVFLNEEFGDTIIAPGLTGKYKFMLENRNKDEILFDLTFSCENEYGIKLVYRLKRDGAYVSGFDGYVEPEQLGLYELTQQAHSTSVFEIEWKWEHNDSVDTIAGESGAMYTLNIHYIAKVNLKQ